ncbi:MAG: M55 family metallopeptidase [Desulfobacterales bacterium]|nr:M55 family metallopeptidase [Desulfobacterales bacterium]
MTPRPENILIIADIEGSSDCLDYAGSSFKTGKWARACMGMTKDVGCIVSGLFDAGVKKITVKDFHRTGYNILPEYIDPPAKVVPGYRKGPVPGIGDPGDADVVMFIGLHAASGTGGFLAHTLTSRIAKLEVNGRLMPEIELFSASLAPFGLRPIFFSGCPVACCQAEAAIKGIQVYSIDKSNIQKKFHAETWRNGLVKAAVGSLANGSTQPYLPEGACRTVVTMRDGTRIAEKLAKRWGYDCEDDRIYIQSADILELYNQLIRMCYLTPFLEKILPVALPLYNLWGRMGLNWVRRMNALYE